MNYQPQHLTAPDGTRLVVITDAEYQRLMALDDDATDIAEANAALARYAEDGAAFPSVVVDKLLDGMTPVKAWRHYRRMTQAELADAAGLSQAAISALEDQPSRKARPKNLAAIAKALDIPVSLLELS